MTPPEQVKPEYVRASEIALSRYFGCEAIRPKSKPDKFIFLFWDNATTARFFDSEEEAFAKCAPKWSTDESLLSTLMKGLAGKGWLPELSANIGDRSDKEWEATLNGMNKDYVEYGDSPLEAVFNCAASLPEVQALINEHLQHAFRVVFMRVKRTLRQ
jgi:hypothetical protein